MNKILDLSEHNGEIDFLKVKEAGIKDVILRLGWIGNKENHTLDKKFETYYAKSKYYGFNIGIYVYSYCKTLKAIKSGCEWIKKNIKELNFNLPIFLDLEDETILGLSKTTLTNHAIYFCDYFKNSGVYASKYWFETKLDTKKLEKYKIWLAEWNRKMTYKGKVYMWQYTSKGKVSGIKGNVDVSNFVENVDNNVDNVEKDKKEEFEVAKKYKNGSTPETVYADSGLTIKIGQLNRNETCECLGITNGKFIVRYKVNNTNNYKVGFVKYSGGVI